MSLIRCTRCGNMFESMTGGILGKKCGRCVSEEEELEHCHRQEKKAEDERSEKEMFTHWDEEDKEKARCKQEMENLVAIELAEQQEADKKKFFNFCKYYAKENKQIVVGHLIVAEHKLIIKAMASSRNLKIELSENDELFPKNVLDEGKIYDETQNLFLRGNKQCDAMYVTSDVEINGFISDEEFKNFDMDVWHKVDAEGLANTQIFWIDSTFARECRESKDVYFERKNSDGIRIPYPCNFAIAGEDKKVIDDFIVQFIDAQTKYLSLIVGVVPKVIEIKTVRDQLKKETDEATRKKEELLCKEKEERYKRGQNIAVILGWSVYLIIATFLGYRLAITGDESVEFIIRFIFYFILCSIPGAIAGFISYYIVAPKKT